jgi:hypothetical protein
MTHASGAAGEAGWRTAELYINMYPRPAGGIYAPPGSRKQWLSAWFWSHYYGNLKSKPQLFWRRYKGKFELTYVSKSTVVVKTLSSGSRTVVSSGEQPSLKLVAAANRPHQQNQQAVPA